MNLFRWHLAYGSPEDKINGKGWMVFNVSPRSTEVAPFSLDSLLTFSCLALTLPQSILGWDNNATVGSILAYCFFWYVFARFGSIRSATS